MSPEGIEPPSQEPESYVISITLRRQQCINYNRGRKLTQCFYHEKKIRPGHPSLDTATGPDHSQRTKSKICSHVSR